MIQNFRPGYNPPNREQLSGNLLEVCDDVEEKLRKQLSLWFVMVGQIQEMSLFLHLRFT